MASIQKRGDTFYITVYAGKGPDGKYIRHTKTVEAKNKTEAKQLAAAYELEVKSGEYIKPEKMLLREFVNQWKDQYGREHLSAKSLQEYELLLMKRILPVFGHRPLDSIKPMELVNFFNAKETRQRDNGKGEVSSATLNMLYRATRNLFTRAHEWKMISLNPMASVKRPKVDTAEMSVYTREDFPILFAALEREPLLYRVMINLALVSGLRQGELLGLTWDNIDLDNRLITVAQSLSYTKAGGLQLKAPKTKGSKRTLAISSEVVPLLKEWKKQCNKNRLKCEDLWEGGEHFLVFSAWNGKPLLSPAVSQWWARFVKRTDGLKTVRFHDLRHSSATYQLMSGVPLKAISKRLGHSNSQITLETYLHVVEEMDRSAADTFDTIFDSKLTAK